MTEAIKQWIENQVEQPKTEFWGKSGYEKGITKGIEIAEGFAEWIKENEIPVRWVRGEKFYSYHAKYLTTSQLLEQYLKTLEP